MGGLDSDSQKTGTSIMDIAKGIGVFKLVDAGINMVKDSVGGAIKRFDTLNNSTRSFENMGFAAGEVDKTMEQLKKSINGLPTPLDAAISNVQLLASSTDNLGKSEEIFAAMNNGILGFGGTTAMVDNAVVQLSQSFSNGKVDAATWNSMINAGLGPTLSALGKTMGKTTGELKAGLSDGSISVEQFQDALINLNKNGGGGLKSLEKIAQDATGGIGTGLANMKTAVTRGMANIISAINDSLKDANLGGIGKLIGEIGAKFETGLSKVAELIPPTIKTIGDLYKKIEPFKPLILGIIGFIATYQTVMGTAKKAVQLYTAAQEILNAVMNANPIGLLITAILILVGTIMYLWNTNEDFRNDVIKIWETIKKAFSDAAEWVKKAWDGVKQFFSDIWKGLTDGVDNAVQGVKDAWGGTKQWFSDLWSGVKGTSKGAWDGMKTGAESAGNGVKDAWKGAKDWFKGVGEGIADVVNTIKKPFEPLLTWFSGLWESIKSVATSYWEIIKSVIMAPILVLVGLITGDFGQLKEDLIMIWDTIMTNAANIFNTIKDTIVGYVTALVQTASNLWTIMSEFAVTKWNEISTKAKEIWTNIQTWFTQTIDNIVKGTVQGWENLRKGTIDAFNATINWIKTTWTNLKTWFIDTVKAIVTNVTTWWDNLKKNTVTTFNNMVTGAKNAWTNLVDSVKETVDKVISWFTKLGEIDLWEAGKAIMDGFLKGLKGAWKNVQDFVGGIGDWIRDHKGPISYDKRLLIPAGNAIMDSLNSGLLTGFKQVKSTVGGMADDIANSFGARVAMPALDGFDSAVGKSMTSSINANSELLVNSSKQSLKLDVHLGNQVLEKFVDDVSQTQGGEIDIVFSF
ncbi:tape measure protein [uncultured Vagococcus sp.]|uniref:tape measure protein n=1 Tax=uncultured Vagococcus sp. TaxID=189676 RepID=UPI0028D71499|nr:tape measure protein [uncultured Vagococcus sp.]